jgi:hypothetical protein
VRVRFLTYLLAVCLTAGSLLLVGCGGEELQGQQNDQSKGSQSEQTAQNAQYKGEENTKQAGPSWYGFKGTVTSILPDKDSLTVKRKNGKSKTFTYKPDKLRVRLGGEKVGPDAIEKGQLVRVNYVGSAKKGNIAHSVRIRSKNSGASSGQTTG